MNTTRINNASNLCEDPETKGFDLEAGQSWIYPTNYPVRDYQYNIIEQAIHKNTLVSLPTGLGKTFIAAVVMYNFYRWYPHGKIIFMAPTRPLVEQQIDACYNIMAIPQEVTAELTGAKKSQASRVEVWQNKRVFFITPQVLQNDLETVIELGEKIKCLVFDEAHRAKGNYSYCEVIRKLVGKTKLFRVLALSATPGNSVKDVGEVMQNLLIAHLEFRSEESPDVKPYVFERSLETVVVPLGPKLQQIKEDYEKILEKYVRTLVQYKVITTSFSNLTKGKIFMTLQSVKQKRNGYPNYTEITKTLNICVTLYHAYEALIRCGLRVFLTFYEEHINNPLLHGNGEILNIMEDVREYLGPAPNVETLPDGSYTEIPASTRFGHPKFYHLRDILLSHFSSCDNSSRVIVFFEYRESVKEAFAILSQNRPIIKARIFVGQSAGGQRQKDQIYTVKAFREGTCNTLLSTCIGEEGLDVGEVNLIVCFDITNKSPIRMIQRMGRTGRKKEGRIVVLVTQGKEQQTLKDCLIYKNNLRVSIGNSQQLEDSKYKENPIMIPSYIHPKCHKMFITVKKPAVIKKNRNLKQMLRGLSSDSPKFPDDLEIKEVEEKLDYKPELFCNKASPLDLNHQGPKIDFYKHVEKQRIFQASGEIRFSKQTEILVSLLQSSDSKRYNLPVTQTNSRFGNDVYEHKNYIQGDIRTMFSRVTEAELNEPLSQLSNFEKEKDITHYPEELFHEISNFLSIQKSLGTRCKICEKLFECPKTYYHKSEPIDLSSWVQPDLSILASVTIENLEIFNKSLAPKCAELEDDSDVFDNFQFTQLEKSDERVTEVGGKSFYKTPKSFDKILNLYTLREDDSEANPRKIEEKGCSFDTPRSFRRNLQSSKYQEDEEYVSKHQDKQDIFMDEPVDSDETIIYTPDIKDKSPSKTPKVKITSPDLFEESPDLFSPLQIEDPKTPFSEKGDTPIIEDSESPVICTLERMQRMKAKRKLFSQQSSQDLPKKPNLANLKTPQKSFFETRQPKTSPKKNLLEVAHSSDLDISDVCDLSEFGLSIVTPSVENKKDKVIKESDIDISDVCDLSVFGLTKTQIDKGLSALNRKSVDKIEEETKTEPVKQCPKEDFDINDMCDMSIFFEESISNKNIETSQLKSNIVSTETDTNDNWSTTAVQGDTASTGTDDWFNTVNESLPKRIKDTPNTSQTKRKKDEKKTEANTNCNWSTPSVQGETASTETDDWFNTVNESLPKRIKDTPNTSQTKRKKVEEKIETNTNCNWSTPSVQGETASTGTDDWFNIVNESVPKRITDTPNTSQTKGKKVEAEALNRSVLCDVSSFHGPEKNEETKPSAIIDLTDSDFESSPVKIKTQPPNKTLSQLSITQMLNFVAKSNDDGPSKSNSQKENSTPKRTVRKNILSLKNQGKGVSQPKQNFESPKPSQTTQKKNNNPANKKSKFNWSLGSNSDDDFETTTSSPIFAKPRPCPSSASTKKDKMRKTVPLKKKKAKRFHEYLDDEAELAEDGSIVISEDEDSGEDCFEASFVDDETQNFLNNTTMHAEYLKTTKSPPTRGKFKIPERPRHNVTNVFSQEVDNADDTYLNDSFVVNTQDVDSPRTHELSDLEILEMKLEQKKKSKKRKSEDKSDGKNMKKRRILVIRDEDSD